MEQHCRQEGVLLFGEVAAEMFGEGEGVAGAVLAGVLSSLLG